ncbi:DUF2793 domain-containing protein [Pseudooceanicola sp.]|uniref:DUF2793 domain-containing protein n=1 Tax=Pseudooceanicola sp. TaxID=1914328 RepID=UPI0035C6CC49
MTDRSANLSLPYILPSQAQKHVTHNEALVMLDALVQLTVESAQQTAPPAAPDAGVRFIVPDGATGDWSGRAPAIALRDSSGWIFLDPAEGWLAWVVDVGGQMRFDGTGWVGPGDGLQNVESLGVNTTADLTNRLAVASPASLLSHDGAGHQVKVNKAAAGDTASLLLQSGWSGRAEIGLVGNDDLVFKVSDDGATFRTAFSAAATSGVVSFPQGVSGLTSPDLGAPDLATQDYVAARLGGLVSNGGGHLPSALNFPAGATRDTAETPDLPAAFSFAGHYPGPAPMAERLAVDPHACYAMTGYLRQESVAGDWSAHAEEERHQQGIGLICLDSDGLTIEPRHHLRFRAGGTDSLTTLAAPLAPGDTVIALTDASGWNDSVSGAEDCGVILFGYRTSGGRVHQGYSRLVAHDLFAPAGVNKTTHEVTLTGGFPAALGNPDDGGGVWPVGTPIANTATENGHKMCLVPLGVPAATDLWYRAHGHIGGIDLSGTDAPQNFAPGTAYVTPVFLPNHSNRSGGWSGFADTGATQRIWFAGISLRPDPLAVTVPVISGATSGSRTLYAPLADTANGEIDLVSAAPTLAAL